MKFWVIAQNNELYKMLDYFLWAVISFNSWDPITCQVWETSVQVELWQFRQSRRPGQWLCPWRDPQFLYSQWLPRKSTAGGLLRPLARRTPWIRWLFSFCRQLSTNMTFQLRRIILLSMWAANLHNAKGLLSIFDSSHSKGYLTPLSLEPMPCSTK